MFFVFFFFFSCSRGSQEIASKAEFICSRRRVYTCNAFRDARRRLHVRNSFRWATFAKQHMRTLDSLDRTEVRINVRTKCDGAFDLRVVAFLMRSSGQSLAVRSSVPFLSGSIYKSPDRIRRRTRARSMRSVFFLVDFLTEWVARRERAVRHAATATDSDVFSYVDYK